MRFTRLVIDTAIAHSVGSYAAAVVLAGIFSWFGMRDIGFFLAAAPLTLPLLALADNAQTSFQGVAVLLPPYVIGFAVAWLLLLRRHRRLDRLDRIAGGLCLSCGYNLTGNTSGVCPECGASIIGVSVRKPV